MLKKNWIIRTFLFLSFVFFALACDKNRVFEKNIDLPDYVWNNKNKVSFEVPIEDTQAAYNIYLNVRNAGGYPYSNIYIFVNTQMPDKKIITDTVECILADNTGKWLGDGSGDIWDNQILYKKNIKFPVKGTYVFTYEQAMRVDDLPMIMDVGLRVERAENN